jgi:hypothetical protein
MSIGNREDLVIGMQNVSNNELIAIFQLKCKY